MAEPKKRGRPLSTEPPVKKIGISVKPSVLEKIDKDRGTIPRSPFLLNKAGYGGKP